VNAWPRSQWPRLWYRAVLCDGPIGAHHIPVIREHFADALDASGWPEGACLFLSGRRTAGTAAGEDDTDVPEAVFATRSKALRGPCVYPTQ